MPEYQRDRGVPLPSFGQLLLVAAVVCAGLWIWLVLVKNDPSRSPIPPHLDETAQNSMRKLQTVNALVRLGSEAVPELLEMLSDKAPKNRRLALHGLEQLGAEATSALPAVRQALADENAGVRSDAVLAFARICIESGDLLRTLPPLLADPDNTVRETVTRFLDGSMLHFAGVIARREPDSQDRRQLTPEENEDLIRNVAPLASSERSETRDIAIRIVAIRDFNRDHPLVTELLRSRLDDDDPGIRATAITRLAERGVVRVEEVRAKLHDPDPNVVDAGIDAVCWLGSEGQQVVPDLLPLTHTMRYESLARLIDALRFYKASASPAVPVLVRRVVAIQSEFAIPSARRSNSAPPSREVRAAIRRLSVVDNLLELDGDPVELLPLLKPFIASADAEFATKAAAVLKQFDPEGTRAVAAQMIHDIEHDANRDHVSTTVKSLQVLSNLGSVARDAVPLLLRLIDEDDRQRPWISWYAIDALGGIGPEAAQAVPRLTRFLEEAETGDVSDARVEVAVRSLGKIGSAARDAIPAILKQFDGVPPPEPFSGGVARVTPQRFTLPYQPTITALGAIGEYSPSVLVILRQAAAIDRPRQYRLPALKALLLVSRQAEAIPPELISALDDESADLRFLGACLGSIPGDKTPAIPRLIAALDDKDPRVASAAALSLREIGPAASSAAPRLRLLIDDPRNRAPNLKRSPRSSQLRDFRFNPGNRDVARLSVAEAARLALEAIAPPQN